MTSFSTKVVFFSSVLLLPFVVSAQNSNGSNANALSTAVPSLIVSPDSRSGAMGDAGVALSPDANAAYYNPSKLAFLETPDAVSISYSPWLRNLVPDISLSYLSYAHKLDERNSVGLALRYFDVGTIQGTDATGANTTTFRPSDFSFDATLARQFGDDFSLGLTLRYIHSNLANGSPTSPTQGSGNDIAADVSFYYKKTTGDNNQLAFGADISNIGPKMTFGPGQQGQYLPTNLKIGAANTWNFDDISSFTLALDLNKLLVPTQPNSDVSVPAGIFQSFTDAGASGEFKEIYYSLGAEYWYNKTFALRTGYYYENQDKGGRQYLTLGVGVKYQDFGFDFSYLAASQQNSPLANTLRFTLSAAFGGTK